MNILLVNPRHPDTYWSFRHAIRFISKKASNPPLGLITVSAILPQDWSKKVTDLNCQSLEDSDIRWADYVFISAMSIQSASVAEVIQKCKALNKKIVAGGPLFTGDPESFEHLDHLILNEAELTLPLFLADLESNTARRVYKSDDFADLNTTPVPDYSLIKASNYAQLSLQYSRGCPHHCDFCEITALLGHKVRTKSSIQIIKELENIFITGFRGNLFFVDDNFIGNRHKLKNDLLPAISEWNKKNKHPFTFTTEASIDLSDDPGLMEGMAEAGFEKVFIGIETPDEAGLKECHKHLNLKRNLLESVHRIQSAGIEVTAGFIVGFDSDSAGVFQHQIDFIQKSGIITAMVGLLNAPNRTTLYKRLRSEGRILNRSMGDNTNYSMNFIPKMNKEVLLEGYRNILNSIYSNEPYHLRLKVFLKKFEPAAKAKVRITRAKIGALLRSILFIGILSKGRLYYWKLILWSLFTRPKMLPLAITYSIYGYHFRKVYNLGN
ncbi:MAG: DUF4070 domain-containing protein [Bacteroides sp.]|nr:DUF4070 domain-containing protein [Bacteroides sp.]